MVREKLRTMPSGRMRKRANTWRVRREPRDTSRRLMVMAAFAPSPVNRFETETPSSASRPWPVLARASMIEASSGRLATSTRPSSRSYQRKAGTPSALPCRMACWLAGVVHGTWTVHSCTAWLPSSSHRRRVGMVPDLSTHCMTGNATPSSWTNTTPSTSGSVIAPGLILSRLAAKDSSVPALTSQTSSVPTAAAIQAAATAVANESKDAPGTMFMASCITTA